MDCIWNWDGVTVVSNLCCHLAGSQTIAQDKVHELNEGFSLNRFSKGYLLDEKDLEPKLGYLKC